LGKTNNQDFKITIDGTIFDERVKAGERLMLLPKLEDWKDKDTPLSVGEYRGIQISIEHATFNSVEFVLKGSHSYRGDLGISELGAVVRIENAVEHIPKMLEKEKQQLDNYIRQLEEAKKEIGKPFEYEERLTDYVGRLSEINTKLEFKELQNQEEVIIDEDGERPDDEENQPFERVLAYASAEV
jgi:hypothetical protein